MLRRPEIFDDDHLPRQLLHREAELTQLLEALDPGPDNADRGHAVIAGPQGVGKTVLTRYCSRELRRERSVDVAYVRCLGSETGTVLRDVLDDLGSGAGIPHTMPVEDVVDELHSTVDGTAIAVLDEADDIPDRAIEYLTDVRGISIAMICHDPDAWFSHADPEVRERLQAGTLLALDRYHVDELADILKRRANVGLATRSVTRGQLEQIADDVAGVARHGIQTLRCAAERARDDGRDQIVDSDLPPACKRARQETRASNLASLPFRYQYLYAVVRDAGEISSRAIYDHYDAVGDRVWQGRPRQPPRHRTIRDHLRKLRQYDLIASDDGIHRVIDPELEPTHDQVPDAPIASQSRH